jgi:transposase
MYKTNKPELYKKAIIFSNKLRFKVTKDISLLTFATGSHRRIPILNNTVIKSNILYDPTNKKFKYWYALELPIRRKTRTNIQREDGRKIKPNTNIIWLPLEHNRSFHGNIMDKYETNSVLTITYTNNKLKIGLMREANTIAMKEHQRAFGGDIGTARWLLAMSGDDGTRIGIEADNERTSRIIKKLLKIDNKLGLAAELKNSGRLFEFRNKDSLARRQLKNVIEANQAYMEVFSSKLLDLMEEQNITDLTLENLELNLTISSNIKYNNLKLTRVVRMLRLSSFKNIVKNQGSKRGIRVHLISAAYTSQECPKCHYIDKSNRNQDKFKCGYCGHVDEADFNAAANILGRTLVDGINNIDTNFCIVAKKLTKDTIKSKLSKLTKPYNLNNGGCSTIINKYMLVQNPKGVFVLFCSPNSEIQNISDEQKKASSLDGDEPSIRLESTSL